ncbi:MAG: ThuA domain-containing protein [Chloroflexaceae bacterium]|jgi:type 1 glutamine amidotransferase|nr:ThuA domain-containing protein [Chloroflexaceae bacterium]
MTPTPPPPATFRVLVFSKTAGFRHGSIEAGLAAIRQLASQHNFSVDATEDSTAFSDANLAQYQAVVFLQTTGDLLDENQQNALQRYIRAGGGFVGIHAAADAEYDWPWYGELVGAYFKSHPAIQQATLVVENRTHPSTRHLPERWTRTDEWYNFRTNPRPNVSVLISLDESSYQGGDMGDHPIAWFRPFDGGRTWYTGLGHGDETFSEPLFQQHLLGGILWAAGQATLAGE